MKLKSEVSLIGWYGVLAILLAYALVTFSVVNPHNYPYQLLNLTGAISLVIEAYSKRDYQPATLNVVWSIIALIAIIQIAVR
jgi:hypothetical protein